MEEVIQLLLVVFPALQRALPGWIAATQLGHAAKQASDSEAVAVAADRRASSPMNDIPNSIMRAATLAEIYGGPEVQKAATTMMAAFHALQDVDVDTTINAHQLASGLLSEFSDQATPAISAAIREIRADVRR